MVVKELSHILIITKIEHLLHTLQAHFARSLKCHIEFTNLIEVMHIKGLMIIQNVKTCMLLRCPL